MRIVDEGLVFSTCVKKVTEKYGLLFCVGKCYGKAGEYGLWSLRRNLDKNRAGKRIVNSQIGATKSLCWWLHVIWSALKKWKCHSFKSYCRKRMQS